MENEENRIIETVDEEGNVITFELYDIVEVDEKEYALLLPTEDNDNDSDEGSIVIMRLSKDGEDYIFETIDDDSEFNKVAEYVESLAEEYDEDNEEE